MTFAAPLLLAAVLAAPAEPTAVPVEPAPAAVPASPVHPVYPAVPVEPSPPPPPPRSTRAALGERPVSLIGIMGFDFGSTKLATFVYTDGTKETLRANQGFFFSVGAAFLKLHLDQVTLDTAATIGIKGWNIGTGDDTLSYRAFPFELLERLSVDQVRFGAGLNYALSPRIRGDGMAATWDVDLENAPGLVVQAEWIGRRRPGQFGGMIGVRYLVQKLKSKLTGSSIDSNAFGITLGIEY